MSSGFIQSVMSLLMQGYRKTALFWGGLPITHNPYVRQEHLSLLCAFTWSLDLTVSFARSMEVVVIHHYRPLKPLKHTQIISNTLHLCVVTRILTKLWTHCYGGSKYQRSNFSGRSDTVPGSQRLSVNVAVTTWSQ